MFCFFASYTTFRLIIYIAICRDLEFVCSSTIVCAGAILKESTCLLRHITTEKSGLCQYAVCITQNTTLTRKDMALSAISMNSALADKEFVLSTCEYMYQQTE